MLKHIKHKLAELNPFFVEVIDQSYKHIRHSGYSDKGSHFDIIIVSDEFVNLSRILRHKIIYEILKKELNNNIHALSIKAFTIEEYKKILL